ncbi:MAG: cytochrome P450 [Ilumatobacteraceae bacterium]
MTPMRVGPPQEDADGRIRITRVSDVSAALRQPSLAVGPRALERRGVDTGPLVDLRRGQLINMNGEEHSALRRTMERAFSPRAVRRMQESVARRSHKLVDEIDFSSPVDLVDRLAFRLPISVIADMLGLEGDVEAIREFSSALVRTFDPDLDDAGLLAASDAASALSALVREAIAERRDDPRDDLLSDLVESARVESIPDSVAVANAILLVTAGFETTMGLIANSVLLLTSHRAALAEVVSQPQLTTKAVEETLRLESPISSIVRMASDPVVIGGKSISAGQDVIIDLAAANRDPNVFEDADSFRLTRTQNSHVAFGGGPHFCLGAALGRLEGNAALSALLPWLPRLTLLDEVVQWKNHPTVHCPARMPVVLS